MRAAAIALCASLGVALRSGRKSKSQATWKPKMTTGNWSIPRPAFLSLDPETNDVFVSQFGTTSKWNPLPAQSTISTISAQKLGRQIDRGRMSTSEVKTIIDRKELLWPNKISFKDNMMVIPDGFLPPGKNNGNVFLASKDGASMTRVTPKVKGAFYHEVEWHDFDGDGNDDMLAARTITAGLIPSFRGELVWYRNPGKGKWLTQEWEENIICDGPDVVFRTMPYKGGIALFATQFFSQVLKVHFITADGKLSSSRIIDDDVGKAFGVEIVDLDGDGRDELLVTNHEDKIAKSAVFAYELPEDLSEGTFKRHVLADGIFHVGFTIFPGAGAPGFAHAFHPRVGTSKTEPKHIVVAGDGSKDVWYLAPTSSRFGYTATKVHDFKGTTGEMLVTDLNGDGIIDVVVPDNDNFLLRSFTFEQSS